MKVLLVSPKDPENPKLLKYLMGGENTYTLSLIKNPPPSVNYTYFADALSKKEVVYTFWQKIFSFLIKIRLLPPDVGYQCIRLNKKFDLIHAHGYALKIDGSVRPPVVLSDSSSNVLFLKEYLHWGRFRIWISYLLRKFIAARLGVYDPNVNTKDAPLVVWSEFARNMHVQSDYPPSLISVIPPGIARGRAAVKKTNSQFVILFVGTWFLRKGGAILLQAFFKLKKKYPHISLQIIGEVPKHIKLPKNVWQKDFVSYADIMKDIFPKSSVLVNIPPIVEGYGVVVEEAYSFGIPAIVSSVCALPELVENGKTGFVVNPGSVVAVEDALEKLIINPNLLKFLGKQAKRAFKKKYEVQKTNARLLAVYRKALRGR